MNTEEHWQDFLKRTEIKMRDKLRGVLAAKKERNIRHYMENPNEVFERLTDWDRQSRTWWQRETILNEIIDRQRERSLDNSPLYDRNRHIAVLEALEAEQRLHQTTLEAAE